MSLQFLKKKYIGSCVDTASSGDPVNAVLELVDANVCRQGIQLFQHFVLDTLRGSNLGKPFQDYFITSGMSILSSHPLFTTARLFPLANALVQSDKRQQLHDTAIQLSSNPSHHQVTTTLSLLVRNSESPEEIIVTLLYFCYVMVQARFTKGHVDNGFLIDWIQQFLSSAICQQPTQPSNELLEVGYKPDVNQQE